MELGYDGKLYILAFDHRGSFQKKMFGIEGDPTDEQTDQIADAKHLIFEGLLKASEQGAEPDVTGCLVDEQFGAPKRIPEQAKERGLILAMPVEKSGQDEFDFDYGEEFGEHIERFDPAFSKVLVRFNPDGDPGMNERQTKRLRRLSDWLHEHDRKFLFELLVPAEPAQLEAVGGDTDRFDRRAAPGAHAAHHRGAPGCRRGGGHLEDRGDRHAGGLRADRAARPAARAATGWCAWCSAAARTTRRWSTGCARGRRWKATPGSRSDAPSGGTP